MAVKTGAIFNSLIFGGINSADYGIYITGEAVYNAPERAVEMVSVPGRNGAIVIDQGHWNNIQVTYPAGTFGKTQEEFREAVSAFRNAVLSQLGYQRLTDTYHPDEYRMAVYVSGLEVDPTQYGSAGEFKLKFDCKPQRWLTEGEQEITVGEWGETQTATGETVTIENPNGNLKMKSLTLDIEPIQNLNGYDHPWVGGARKNKLQNQATSQTINGITWTVNPDGTVTANGTATVSSYLTIWGDSSVAFEDAWEMTENMRLSCDSNAWPAPLSVNLYSSDGRNMAAQGSSVDISAGRRIKQIRLYVPSGQTVSDIVFKPMLRASGTSPTYEPYENICPINGNSAVYLYTTPPSGTEESTTLSLGRTVYGGTLDVVSGVLTVDRQLIVFNGDENIQKTSANNFYFEASLVKHASDYRESMLCNELPVIQSANDTTTSSEPNWISGYDTEGVSNRIYWHVDGIETVEDMSAWLAANPIQILYPMLSSTTYQLTPTQVELLTGDTTITYNKTSISDRNITAEYGQDPDVLYNPTPYDASPLLMVEGYGTIGFNGYEVSIDHNPMGEALLHYAGNGIVSERYVRTESIEFNQALVNNGDEIYFYRYSSSYFHSVDFRLKSIHITDVESRTYTNSNPDVTSSSDLSFSFDNISFIAGTPQTVTNTCTITAVLRNGGGTETASWTGTISYDGNNKIAFTITQSPSSHVEFGDTGYINWTDLYADSTVQALGHPTYIDCDLGDAYMIKDGSYISLNSYIDLGSDLPVLASGNNPVTKDSTITELKIVPRWWIL